MNNRPHQGHDSLMTLSHNLQFDQDGDGHAFGAKG